MSFKSSKTGDGQTKLTVILDSAELRKIKDHVIGHMAKDVKVPGFRSGKAPLSLIEKQLDSNALANHFLEEALNHSYEQAIKDGQIRPLSPPSITIKKFVPFDNLEYEAVVSTFDDIKLADYKKIKRSKNEVKITDKDVKEVINNLQNRIAERKTVVRPAKAGDEVTIDFKGVDAKGEPVKGAEGQNYGLKLGSSSFIPGFEDNLIGLKPAAKKTFTLTFPKDYRIKALAGKKVSFEVKLLSINELVLPKVDDEFAAKSGPFKTVEELEADIKKQLKLEREYQAQKELEADIVREIINKSQLVVPDVMVNDQVDFALKQLKQNLAYRGQTYEEFLSVEGLSDDQYRSQVLKPEAQEKVQGGLLLSAIAEKEGLFVTPEEFEVRLQLLKGQYTDPLMQAELEKPENRRDVVSRLLTEKTLAKLVDYATA